MAKKTLKYEQQLLFRCIANGDTDAFKVVFDIYQLRLFSASFELTKSVYAAEEIVQETFTTLWIYRDKLSEVDHPFSYIMTIAYNHSCKFLKKKKRLATQQQAFKKCLDTVCPEPERLLEMKEMQNIIDQAVKNLPLKRQRVFRLSREKGLSYRQIAELLDISPSTVKKHLSFALQGLRSALQQELSPFHPV